jgi:PAS domain S-box-containing protein
VNEVGEVVLLNLQAEKQLQYRREQLVGQHLRTIIPEIEQSTLDAVHAAGSASHEIGAALELRGRRKDGSEYPIEITLSALSSVEGMLVAVAIRDITARKATDAQLRRTLEELNRSNEELGQFAYLASHDLQEPLRMVASYTQLLSRRYKGQLDAEADEFIRFAVEGANRMQRLIQDLLAYSRVGTTGAGLVETSSEAALDHAVENLGGAIEDSGAVVTHDTMPMVMADEGQLIQLFQNLVGNAIKYRRPGSPLVHIASVKTGKSKWLFSVNDNGLGIEPQYFERIFGMFQRLHGREEFEGTGIGLAICKKIAARHGGTISVESELGRGSTFRFALEGCAQS